MTCARYVSLPTFSMTTVRAPSPLMAPPMTASPLLDDDCQGTFAVDGTADDSVSRLLVHWARLPGQHGLIHARCSVLDAPVDGDLLTRLDQHTISGREVGNRVVHHRAVGHDDMCIRGHKSRKALQRAGGAHHGLHLQPVTEEHDIDQCRQLPVENHSLKTQRDCGAVYKGHRDCHRDECHHARGPGPELFEHAFEEGHAAVHVDERR